MAKRKGYKIKRYSNIYKHNRNRRIDAGGIILIVIGVLILGFIGWSVYDPVYNFLTGNMDVPSISSSEDEVISDSSTDETEPDPTASEVEKEKEDTGYIAANLPFETASNPANLEKYIASVKETGCNSVVIELKDELGNVFYKSSNEKVTAVNAAVSNAMDLKYVIDTLKKNEIKPIVKIHAFKDDKAASAMLDAAVRYKPDTKYIWADDDPNNGGKYWLNPNSAQAQEYVIAIAKEAVDMGAEAVILDSVQFPEGYSLNLCDFGSMSSKEQVLEDFMKAAESAVSDKEAKVYFEFPLNEKYMGDNEQYGVSPLKVASKNAAVDLSADKFKSGDVNVSDFKADTANKTALAMGEIMKNSDARENWIVILPSNVELANVKSSYDGLKDKNVNGVMTAYNK